MAPVTSSVPPVAVMCAAPLADTAAATLPTPVMVPVVSVTPLRVGQRRGAAVQLHRAGADRQRCGERQRAGGVEFQRPASNLKRHDVRGAGGIEQQLVAGTGNRQNQSAAAVRDGAGHFQRAAVRRDVRRAAGGHRRRHLAEPGDGASADRNVARIGQRRSAAVQLQRPGGLPSLAAAAAPAPRQAEQGHRGAAGMCGHCSASRASPTDERRRTSHRRGYDVLDHRAVAPSAPAGADPEPAASGADLAGGQG